MTTNEKEKRVLIVDDENDIRRFLTMALEDAGFQVDTASDGFEALEKVKESIPDLISLDLVMPKRSGAAGELQFQQPPRLGTVSRSRSSNPERQAVLRPSEIRRLRCFRF